MFTLGMENLMLARINLNQRHGHQGQFTYFRGRAHPSQGTKIAEGSLHSYSYRRQKT